MGGTFVVITQHVTSVEQWRSHLRTHLQLGRIFVLGDASSDPWRIGDELPDAVILTYSAMVRISALMAAHEALMRTGTASKGADAERGHLLVWFLHAYRFGTLVLDEVHLAAAEQFRCACRLNARVIVGLSGSLVREDDNLRCLTTSVGPVLYHYRAMRRIRYTILSFDPVGQGGDVEGEGDVEGDGGTELDPARVATLRGLLEGELRETRVVVFCDAKAAAVALAVALGALCLTGDVRRAERESVLQTFRATEDAVLIATKVCDAAVDFPAGSVIVQYYSRSGSRQQEISVADAGRGGVADGSRVYHIVARTTEEEHFVERRVRHRRRSWGRTFRKHRRFVRPRVTALDGGLARAERRRLQAAAVCPGRGNGAAVAGQGGVRRGAGRGREGQGWVVWGWFGNGGPACVASVPAPLQTTDDEKNSCPLINPFTTAYHRPR